MMSEPEFNIHNDELIGCAVRDGTLHLGGDAFPDFLALIPAGLAYCRMMYVNGKPDNFIYIYTNPAFHSETGLGPVCGKYISEILPDFRDTSGHVLDIYGRVALTGVSESFETYVDKLQRWLSIQVFSPKPEHFVALFRDITQRKNIIAEKQFRDLVLEQKAIIESDVVGIGKLKNRTFTWVNAALAKMLGYSRCELIGQSTRFMYPSDQAYAEFGERIYQSIRRDEILRTEIELIRKDGSKGWYQICCGVLDQAEEDWIASFADVTDRKRLDLALFQSEERYRSVVEDQTETICRIRPDGTVTFANEIFCRIFGKPEPEIIGKKWHPVAHLDDIPFIEEQLALISPERPLVEVENRVHSGKGEIRWMNFVNRGIFDAHNQLIEIQSVGRDVTQRKEADIALREARDKLKLLAGTQARNLQKLAAELTRAEQHERDALYELMHDQVQPLLVAARLALHGISEHTSQQKSALLRNKADEHITHILELTRNLSRHLSPPLIREQGLIPAMESLFQWINDNLELKVELVSETQIKSIDLSLRFLIFNSIRELLMNVVKHAETNHARVKVKHENNNMLRITLADQGKGFNTKLIRNGSGLSKIQQRLDMFGGSLKIESQLNKGTLVTMLVPIMKSRAGMKRKRGSKQSSTEHHEE